MKERTEIQKCDEMLKSVHHLHSIKLNECRALVANGKTTIDSKDIIEHFRTYFEDLSSSLPPSNHEFSDPSLVNDLLTMEEKILIQ